MICFGIDELIHQNPAWKTKQLGLVTSDAATTNAGMLSRTALVQAGFNIVCLFSPEHGISAKAPDGEAQQNGIDEITGLPIISLYGNNKTNYGKNVKIKSDYFTKRVCIARYKDSLYSNSINIAKCIMKKNDRTFDILLSDVTKVS